MTALIWATAVLFVALAVGIFLWLRGAVPRKTVPEPGGPAREQEAFRFELAKEIGLPAPESPGEPVMELPRSYGRDRLVLLPRDPHWLYAYWEISAARHEDFAQRYGPAAWQTSRPVLRVYDVTGVDEFHGGNALGFVDIPVNDAADSWHIEVGQPDRAYCADLGRVLPGGRFVTLLRSNVAVTPRATFSDRLDEEWMWIEGVYRSLRRLETGVSSPLLIAEVRKRMGAAPLGISSPELITRRGGDS